MSDKKWLRWLGLALLVDAVLALSFGRAYVRFWIIGKRTSPYHRALSWMARWPDWLDRLTGPFFGFFSAKALSEDVYRRFPGLVSQERFGGRTLAMVVLRKPKTTE